MSTLPAQIVGGLLVLAGAAFALLEWRAYRAAVADPKAEDRERLFFAKRLRRRLQTAGLIALVGIALPVGDQLIEQRQAPLVITVFWAGVLFITGWIALLGVADYFSTRTQMKVSMARLSHQRRALEDELERYREQQRPTHRPEDLN